MANSSIVVIIAAYEVQNMIGRAVESALSQPEVAEVIVVDDASRDHTAKTAKKAGNGDQRLKVIVQPTNQGPSAARNLAIQQSRSPLIALLDGDDFFRPNRFKGMLAKSDWDFCADNVVFFSDESELSRLPDSYYHGEKYHEFYINFHDFVSGNISRRKRVRGELGFLKPVMKREFLKRYGMKYNEDCRLGEDFILYSQALANEARFKVINTCGYAALVRADSLSGKHSISDLAALRKASAELPNQFKLAHKDLQIFKSHLSSISRKIVHREVLQTKKKQGLLLGILDAARNPTAIIDILQDRMTPPAPNEHTPRRLLNPENFAKYCV